MFKNFCVCVVTCVVMVFLNIGKGVESSDQHGKNLTSPVSQVDKSARVLNADTYSSTKLEVSCGRTFTGQGPDIWNEFRRYFVHLANLNRWDNISPNTSVHSANTEMEDTLLAKKITRNLVDIKDKISIVFHSIVDNLIELDVVDLGVKQELDAKRSQGESTDHLIQLVIHRRACAQFLRTLRMVGLDFLEEKIRNTNIAERDVTRETTMTKFDGFFISRFVRHGGSLEQSMTFYSEETLYPDKDDGTVLSCSPVYDRSKTFGSQSSRTFIRDTPFPWQRGGTVSRSTSCMSCCSIADRQNTLETRLKKLEVDKQTECQKNEAFQENIIRQLKEEKEMFQEEKERMRKANEELKIESEERKRDNQKLMAKNRSLEEKVRELEKDLDEFREQTLKAKTYDNNRVKELENRNTLLMRELANTRIKLMNKCNENDKQKMHIQELETRLSKKEQQLFRLGTRFEKRQSAKDIKIRGTFFPQISKEVRLTNR